MAVSAFVSNYLSRKRVNYDTIVHPRTQDSAHTAQIAHVPGDHLAKCVVLKDDDDYLMAVIPASHNLDLAATHRQLKRNLTYTDERELTELFDDCEPGAIPALGTVCEGLFVGEYLTGTSRRIPC